MKNELFVAVFLPVTFSIAKMSINHFLNRSEFFNSCEILYLLRSDGKYKIGQNQYFVLVDNNKILSDFFFRKKKCCNFLY